MQRATKLTTATDESIQTVPMEDSTASPQLVYLDFDGAATFYVNGDLGIAVGDITVKSSGFGESDIAAIVASLNGMFDDVVFTSKTPSDAAFSTVYVGVTSAFDGYGRFLGLAETIDSGNQIHDDNAFVMLDSTASTDFVTSVIAHETEHIVHGMEHGGKGLHRFAEDYVVTDGEVINYVEISVGGILRVESDGLVVSAEVYDGTMIVSDGGVAGITPDGDAGSVFIANGGILSVESGGEAHNVTNDGGHMGVVGTVIRTSLCAGSMTVSGGTANSTTMQAGSLVIMSGGLVSSLVVSSQGVVNVSNGGKASTVTLSGTMTVFSGGVAEGIAVSGAGVFTVDGGSAKNINAYYDNGTMTVINNGRAEKMELHSGGTMVVASGGVLYDTMLRGGCTMVVHDGGSASSVSVSGVMYVSDGGVASGNSIAYGVMSVCISGSACATTMSGGTMNVEGGEVSETTMDGGVMNVYSGGSASDIEAMDGTLNVAAEGELDGADIGGATVNVALGAVARNLEVNAGTLNVEAGADVDGVTYNGGTFIISSGATIKNFYKIAGGTVNMYGNAVVDGGVLEGGGYLQALAQNGASGAVIRNYELRGGAADSVIVRAGGNKAENIAVYGGALHVQSGASASEVDVYDGGTITTPDAGRGGATMENIRIHAGGQGIFAANAARAMTIDGLTMDEYATATFSSANVADFNATGGELTLIGQKNYVSGGGTIEDITVLGNGYLWINDPYNATSGGAAYAQMVNSNMTIEAGATVLLLGTNVHGSDTQIWGKYYVQNGATLSGGTIHDGGYLYMGQRSNYNDNGVRAKVVGVTVKSNGTASVADGDFINMAMESGAIMEIFSGGMASATTMSGGTMVVFSGGVASDTIVSGGTMNVSVGGVVAPDTTVFGGSLTLLEGGTHRGMLSIASGAVVSANSGAVIDFTMAAQEDKDVPLIDRYDYIAGAGDATYTLTIASNLETGSYALAGYAANFNSTITVTAAQQELGSLSVNGILKTDDFTYSLFLTDDTLFLGVNLDSEAPVLSSIVASPEDATNQDITVTATFTDNVGVASTQYRINGGAWQNYADGVVMTANGTVEFQATDAVGNVSDIATYNVTNIDKVAPTITDVSADVTEPTGGNVTVTATFSDDVALASKEYRIGDGAWTAYTSGAVVTSNATVQFRAVDTAGNISDIVDYEVTNIIDQTPPILNIAYSTKERTNELITLTVTANKELTKVEYTLTNGKEWIEVEKTMVGFTFTRNYNGNFDVRGTDTHGNVGSATASIWNVDRTGPARPTITASTKAPTNQNVTLTASWSADSVESTRVYSFDRKTWLAYTGPVEVEKNCSVYFRSSDDLGNIGYDREYKVTNIDKTAPKAPTATLSTTKATNQDVTVKSNKAYGVELLEFSMDGETWSEYTGSIVFSENGSVKFRATDAAGNVSPITTCKVSNIDKVAPEAPVVTASVTTPTNSAVRLTATWPADAYRKQFSFNGGSTWNAYNKYVLVQQNTLVLFRAIDKAGNISEIVSQDVNNILPKGNSANGNDVTRSAPIEDLPNGYQGLRGSSGDDVLSAPQNDNLLFGDNGNDRIVGTAGYDVIVGGAGDDSLHGGGGDDLFVFGGNWGQDTIEQLEDGKVTLWFDDGDESKWNAETLTYTDGDKSVAVSGVAEVTLKFGDDGSEQYSNLLASGAFSDFSTRNIFEDKGMLA